MKFFEDVLLHVHKDSIRFARDSSPGERGVVDFELAESNSRLEALPKWCHLIEKRANNQIVDVQYHEGFQLS